MKDGQDIKANEHLEVEIHGNRNLLIINNVTHSDAGLYNVKASNIVNHVTTTFTLEGWTLAC